MKPSWTLQSQPPSDYNLRRDAGWCDMEQKTHPAKPCSNFWPTELWANKMLAVLNHWALWWFVTQHWINQECSLNLLPSSTERKWIWRVGVNTSEITQGQQHLLRWGFPEEEEFLKRGYYCGGLVRKTGGDANEWKTQNQSGTAVITYDKVMSQEAGVIKEQSSQGVKWPSA